MICSVTERITTVCRSFETKAELLAHLQSQGMYEVLGSSTDAKRFYSISYTDDLPNPQGFRGSIGICAEWHGLLPSVLIRPESRLLLVGFDSLIIAISIANQEVLFRKSLRTLFWSFVYLPEEALTLVLYETGALGLQDDGHIRWDYNHDLVTDILLDGGVLELRFSDSPSARIRTSTGATQVGIQ